ncbi:hypothetical protein Tco_1346790 [Tanacetum coccineum]
MSIPKSIPSKSYTTHSQIYYLELTTLFDAVDLFVAAVHDVWRWWSVGAIVELRFSLLSLTLVKQEEEEELLCVGYLVLSRVLILVKWKSAFAIWFLLHPLLLAIKGSLQYGLSPIRGGTPDGGVQAQVTERICCLHVFAYVSVSRGKKYRCQSLPQQPNSSSRWALKARGSDPLLEIRGCLDDALWWNRESKDGVKSGSYDYVVNVERLRGNCEMVFDGMI